MSQHRLETYLDKVFGFSALVGALPEGREFPQHPWKKVFDAVFLGATMRFQLASDRGRVSRWSAGETHRTDQRRHPRLRARKTISRTGVRTQLQIARRLKRNGVLRSGWSEG